MAANYYWGMWGTANRGALCPPEPSWEEQAFARDAAGHLGSGCVWPPRSYTCTFCRREFRSAQALGGHMNVHRRDRARLRQCSSPPTTTSPPHQLQPDYSYTPAAALLSSPKSPDKLDQQAAMIISSTTTSPSYIATIITESKNKVIISMPKSTSTARKLAAEGGDEDESMRKRRRLVVDLSPQPPPFFVRPRDGDAKVIPSPSLPHLVGRQEVDLELRLGID